MNRQKEYIVNWVYINTKDSISVVDLGCGHGSRFKYVNETVKNKIGIEIYKPYLNEAVQKFTKIHGNLMEFETLVSEQFYDCAMLIDVIEHLTKCNAEKLLNKLQNNFNKILIVTPCGFFKQEVDPLNKGNDKYQKHLSGWTKQDLKEFNFNVNIYKNFHPLSDANPRDCIFAIWKKTND